MDSEQLKAILENHKKWVESNGIVGTKADLRGADLQDANLKRANLQDADLQDANLRGADLQDANLQYANLRDANLRGADLQYANLQYANLRGANLQYADLQYANLRDADLRDADLQYANLKRANLQDADIDFSSWPLWCGSLDVHIDNKQAIQLLYHIVRAVKYSKHISYDVKSVLLSNDIINLANKFHRVEECGMIEIEDKKERENDVESNDELRFDDSGENERLKQQIEILKLEISELKSKLELSTPKKPTWIYDDEPLCPNCSEVLDDGEEHCRVCDQRLCWTE